MLHPRRILVILTLCLGAFCLCACPGGDDSGTEKNKPLSARNSVAQVNLAGSAFEVRMPGEMEFKPWKKENGPYLPRGVTVRSGEGLVTFNFLRCVQIQLSPNSVLILQGAVEGPGGKEFLLGLKKGEKVAYIRCIIGENRLWVAPTDTRSGRGENQPPVARASKNHLV